MRVYAVTTHSVSEYRIETECELFTEFAEAKDYVKTEIAQWEKVHKNEREIVKTDDEMLWEYYRATPEGETYAIFAIIPTSL